MAPTHEYCRSTSCSWSSSSTSNKTRSPALASEGQPYASVSRPANAISVFFTCLMSTHFVKIAAKPLQMKTWGYYSQPIGSRYRPIWLCLRRTPNRTPTTYRLVTMMHNDLWRPYKVDDFCLIWKCLCDFLLVILFFFCNFLFSS